MKVKISYTIDFDELPTKVRKLAQETFSAMSSDISSIVIDKQFLDMDETESKMEIISKIQTFRQSLMKYDMQLADYVNLLANYEKARLGAITDEEPTPAEEEDNESG